MKVIKANWFQNLVICAVLLFYTLRLSNQGADLTDTTYSLGNYMNFSSMTGSWKYATYFANLIGAGLMQLAQGKMLYMNMLCNLLVAGIAIGIYFAWQRYFSKKVLLFGELLALSLCWCPAVILYNYITYLLLAMGLLLLFAGLENGKKKYLFFAGLLLGCNVFVRISNLTQMIFILLVVQEYLWNKKSGLWKMLGLCILGYAVGIGAGLGLLVLLEGSEGYLRMLDWLWKMFSGQESAGGYSMGEMLLSIFQNYLGNLKWVGGMLLGAFLGILGFRLFPGRWLRVKKIGYMLGVLLLFLFYYRRGMFSFRYYELGSIYCLAVLLIFLTYGTAIYSMVGKNTPRWQKRMGFMNLLLLLILPLGSNNHVYAVMNGLFIALPLTVAQTALFLKKKELPQWTLPCKLMLGAFVLILCQQLVAFHSYYVFRDGTFAQPRDTKLTTNGTMAGMVTSASHSEALGELEQYMTERAKPDEELILFGNLPGISYYLNRPVALSTAWPDLESYSADLFVQELEAANGAQTIVIVPARISEEEFEGALAEKHLALQEYMDQWQYETVFQNEEFAVLGRQ